MEQFPQPARDETESTSVSTILARSDPAEMPAMRTSLSFLTYAGAEMAGALQKRNQEYDELLAVMSAFPPEWIAAARGGGDLPDLGELRRELEAAKDQRIDLQAQLAERDAALSDLQSQLDEQKALLETQVVREDEADAAVALAARVETLEADIEAAQLARAAAEDALREQDAELDDLEVQLSALNDELLAILSAPPVDENGMSGGEDIPPEALAVDTDAVEASPSVVEAVAAEAEDDAPAAQAEEPASEVVAEPAALAEAEPEIDGRERRAVKLGALFASVAAVSQRHQQIARSLQVTSDQVDMLKGELFAVQSDRMALDADLQEKNQGLADSQAEVETLQTEREGLNAQIDELTAQSSTLQTDLDAANASLTETQEQLTARENELAEIQLQIDSLCQQLGVIDEEQPVAAVADVETATDEQPVAEDDTTVDAEAAVDAEVAATDDGTVQEAGAAQKLLGIGALAAGVSALSEKETAQEAQLAELTAQAESLTAEKTALEEQIAEQEQTIADLNGQIETLNTTVADLQQQLATSQAELNELKEQVDTATVALQGLVPEEEEAEEDEEGRPVAKAVGLAALAGSAATAVHRGKDKEEEYETQLAAYSEQVAALTGEKTDLEAQSQEQAAQIEALSGQVGDLEFTLQDKEKALADYNDSFLTLQGEVNGLAADKSSLETALQLKDEELAQLQAQLADYEADAAQVQEAATRSMGTRAVGVGGVTAGAAAVAALQDKDEQLAEAAAQLESVLAEKAAVEEQLAALNSELEATRSQLASTTPFEEATQISDKLAQMPPIKRGAATAAILAGVQPYFVAGIQTLNDIHGVGQSFQQRFYKAGIGTYWEVSTLSNEALQQSLQIPEIQIDRVDYNGIRSSAYQWASQTETIGALWAVERIDDFEELPGIGAAFEKRLYMAGIFTYQQLADAGRDRLAEIIDAPEFRQPDYGQIIEVARSRAEALAAEAATAVEAEADEAAEANVELDAPAEGEAEAVPEADAPDEEVDDEQ